MYTLHRLRLFPILHNEMRFWKRPFQLLPFCELSCGHWAWQNIVLYPQATGINLSVGICLLSPSVLFDVKIQCLKGYFFLWGFKPRVSRNWYPLGEVFLVALQKHRSCARQERVLTRPKRERPAYGASELVDATCELLPHILPSGSSLPFFSSSSRDPFLSSFTHFLPSLPLLTYPPSFHSCLPSSFSLSSVYLLLPSLLVFTPALHSLPSFLPLLSSKISEESFAVFLDNEFLKVIWVKFLVAYTWKSLITDALDSETFSWVSCHFTVSRRGAYICIEITVCINGHSWHLAFSTLFVHMRI